MDKKEAIKEYRENKIKESKDAFQAEVNKHLDDIDKCSNRLREAKRRFSELKYKEPQFEDIE